MGGDVREQGQTALQQLQYKILIPHHRHSGQAVEVCWHRTEVYEKARQGHPLRSGPFVASVSQRWSEAIHHPKKKNRCRLRLPWPPEQQQGRPPFRQPTNTAPHAGFHCSGLNNAAQLSVFLEHRDQEVRPLLNQLLGKNSAHCVAVNDHRLAAGIIVRWNVRRSIRKSSRESGRPTSLEMPGVH